MARQHQLSRNSPPNIPDEIMATDILPRLPVKSLLRFKSVCKRWCALISDPFFVAAHLDRSKNSPKLAILVTGTMFGDEINVYRYDEQGRHYASFLFGTRFPEEVEVMWRPQQSNGLFLLQSNGLLLVCNPSTRDFTVLPQGSRNPSPYQWRDNDRTGFGYVPSVNAYKVAQYFYRRYSLETRTSSIGFQVLTLGADSSWRDTAVDPPYPIDVESSPACGGGGNCRIYYKIDNRLHTSSMEFILSFDLRDETFAVIPQPYTCITSIDRRFFGTTELGGTLCFLTRSADWKKFEIWMYKDCAGGGSWAHDYTIDLLYPPDRFALVGIRHGKLLFRIRDPDKRLVNYDTETKSIEWSVCIAKDFAYSEGHLTPSKDSCEARKCSCMYHGNESAFQVIMYVESLVPVPR